MTIHAITEILGWVVIINIGILLFSTIMVVVMRETITGIHAQLFGLEQQDLGRAYFQYLAQYKIVILALNLAPYIALKIIG